MRQSNKYLTHKSLTLLFHSCLLFLSWVNFSSSCSHTFLFFLFFFLSLFITINIIRRRRTTASSSSFVWIKKTTSSETGGGETVFVLSASLLIKRLVFSSSSTTTARKMGRKKIQISRITDERNRQVKFSLFAFIALLESSLPILQEFVDLLLLLLLTCCSFSHVTCLSFIYVLDLGHFHETQVWSDEEGIRVECPVWLWNRTHHLQLYQQTFPICEYRHG